MQDCDTGLTLSHGSALTRHITVKAEHDFVITLQVFMLKKTWEESAIAQHNGARLMSIFWRLYIWNHFVCDDTRSTYRFIKSVTQ